MCVIYIYRLLSKYNFNTFINDIFLVRYRTTGVIEQQFQVDNDILHVFDAVGTKSERKKWIHCFKNVSAVICTVSLSGYNRVIFEDRSRNMMHDVLDLFKKYVIIISNYFPFK